jgi:hypothetical protein
MRSASQTGCTCAVQIGTQRVCLCLHTRACMWCGRVCACVRVCSMIERTAPHYIRCINPNAEKRPHIFAHR